MRYVEARMDEYNREEAYRIYVTRSIQLAPQGKYLQVSYLDTLHYDNNKETKSGDDIAKDIITKAGLHFR